MESVTYEDYPAWMVAVSSAVALAIYVAGAAILRGFGLWVAALYVLYGVWVELKVLRGSCVHCAYYGRVCGMGRGKLCALFFPRGDPDQFSRRSVAWKDLLPDLMVSVLPLVGGVILLILDFSWVTLGLMLLLGLSTMLNFDQLFLQFHLLSFTNDFWLLDPSRDYLIMLFPGGFWYDAMLCIAAATAVGAVLLGGTGIFLYSSASASASDGRRRG